METVPPNQEYALKQLTKFEEIEKIEERKNEFVKSQRPAVIDYIKQNNGQQFVIHTVNSNDHLESLISNLRHVPGGQLYILEKLKETNPDLKWVRAGSKRTFSEAMGSKLSQQYHSEEDLQTTVIDRGANGLLGNPICVEKWFRLTPRENPILYTLTLDDLILGLRQNAIKLISEKPYDLRVLEDDRTKYLLFCRDHLKIKSVDPQK